MRWIFSFRRFQPTPARVVWLLGWACRAMLVVLVAAVALVVVLVVPSRATPAGGLPGERLATANHSYADGAQRAGSVGRRWSNYSGDVTIVAKHPSALAGIDALEFVVTRASATTRDRAVPVKLSSGILAKSQRRHTVIIPAYKTKAVLRVRTDELVQGAVTGEVTAVVRDGPYHDVGEPGSASVRMYVGSRLVTVWMNASAYVLAEGHGSAEEKIKLLARTEPNVPAPNGTFWISMSSRARTAMSPQDYVAMSKVVPFPGASQGGWAADGDAFVAEASVPLTILDDGQAEGDETLRLLQELSPGLASTVHYVPASPAVRTCWSVRYCEAEVTIIDDDLHIPDDGDAPVDGDVPEVVDESEPVVVDESEPVVVSLVRVPDGTTVPDGSTVLDGSTFEEGELAWFRVLLSDGEGGPAPGGTDVELSFQWHHHSPLVPTGGQVSRVVLGLPRVDVWDSFVSILENTVGHPDSTLTVRITGCERNRCVIGEPSEITVTIADDDGGPAAAPPDRPQPPWLKCPDSDHSSFETGLMAIWEAPEFEGGAPIESYEVRYRTWTVVDGRAQRDGGWQVWPHGIAATSTTIIGLDAHTLYGVQVRAANANGPGEWSFEGVEWTGNPADYCEFLDQFTEVS